MSFIYHTNPCSITFGHDDTNVPLFGGKLEPIEELGCDLRSKSYIRVTLTEEDDVDDIIDELRHNAYYLLGIELYTYDVDIKDIKKLASMFKIRLLYTNTYALDVSCDRLIMYDLCDEIIDCGPCENITLINCCGFSIGRNVGSLSLVRSRGGMVTSNAICNLIVVDSTVTVCSRVLCTESVTLINSTFESKRFNCENEFKTENSFVRAQFIQAKHMEFEGCINNFNAVDVQVESIVSKEFHREFTPCTSMELSIVKPTDKIDFVEKLTVPSIESLNMKTCFARVLTIECGKEDCYIEKSNLPITLNCLKIRTTGNVFLTSCPNIHVSIEASELHIIDAEFTTVSYNKSMYMYDKGSLLLSEKFNPNDITVKRTRAQDVKDFASQKPSENPSRRGLLSSINSQLEHYAMYDEENIINTFFTIIASNASRDKIMFHTNNLLSSITSIEDMRMKMVFLATRF